MIRWEANFNIPDAAIQTSVAHILATNLKQVDETSTADISITDETGSVSIKNYTQIFDKKLNSLEDVYNELLIVFDSSTLIL